ncbi:hypothetical protein P343_03030 [Sporolactobacillus laevolacticus DSM 442]|uniref:Uncharacterized protein n=1 Tax=Sporolactobacillus laevolacticus DSM 442 TaxID=1395513 RepID=V6J083_9BACL|nr:hypothetical protein P343_03030 [Sporolactobacillus laevolacticus DSM 442]
MGKLLKAYSFAIPDFSFRTRGGPLDSLAKKAVDHCKNHNLNQFILKKTIRLLRRNKDDIIRKNEED